MYAPPAAVFATPPGFYLYDPLFDGTDWELQPAGSTRRINSHIACSDLALRVLEDTEGLAYCRLTGTRYRLRINIGECSLECLDVKNARFNISPAKLLQNHWVLLRLNVEANDSDSKCQNTARPLLNTRVAADALVAQLACFSPTRRTFHAGPWVITGFPDTINYCAQPCKCGIFVSKLKDSVLFVSSHEAGCSFAQPLTQVLVHYNENALYVTNTAVATDGKLPHMVAEASRHEQCTLAVAIVSPLSAEAAGLPFADVAGATTTAPAPDEDDEDEF